MNVSEGCFPQEVRTSQVEVVSTDTVLPQLSAGFRLIPDPSGCYESEFVQITNANRQRVEAERSLFCATELAALATKNAQFEELVQGEALRVQAAIAPKEGYA